MAFKMSGLGSGGFGSGGFGSSSSISPLLQQKMLQAQVEREEKARYEAMGPLGKTFEKGKDVAGFFGGFGKNILTNLGDLASGLWQIGKGAGTAVLRPVETLKKIKKADEEDKILSTLGTIGKTAVDDFKESLAFLPSILTAEPIRNVLKGEDAYQGTGIQKSAEKLYNKPLEFVSDLTLLMPALGAVSKVPGVTKALKATKATDIAELAAKPGMKMAEGISQTPMMQGLAQITQKAKSAQKFRRELTTLKGSYYGTRDKVIKEAFDTFEQPIKKSGLDMAEFEKKLIPVLEGRASLLQQNAPDTFLQVYNDLASKSANMTQRAIEKGFITAEQATTRASLPLKTTIAYNKFKKLPAQLTKAQSATIDKMVKEAMGNMGAKYFPHIDDGKWKIGQLFMTKPGQVSKPTSFKQFTGASTLSDDFIKNPFEAMAKHQVDLLRYEQQQGIIKHVLDNYATKVGGKLKKLKPGEAVSPGMKVFAPDGYLKFFKAQINYGDELAKKIGQGVDIERALADSVEEAIAKLGEELGGKSIMSISKKVPLYEIPEEVAKVINQEFGGYLGQMEKALRVVYDAPTNVWRTLVLPFAPRWLVNNFLGGGVLSVMAGTKPSSYMVALGKKLDQYIPDEALQGFHQTEARLAGLDKLLRVEPGMIERAEGVLTPLAKVTTGVKKVAAKSYQINEAVDDFFRKSVYIDEATKLAKEKYVVKMGEKLDDSIDLLKRAADDQEIIQKAISKTEEFLGDFKGLSQFERKVVRRVFPFWTWTKHINKLAVKYPIKHPIGDHLIEVMADVATLALSDDQEDFEKNAPDYMMGELVLDKVFEGGETKYKTLGLRGATPFSGVGELSVSNVNPLLKMMYELSAKESSFTGAPFTSAEIPYPQYTGEEVPLSGSLIGQQLIETNPITKLLQTLVSPYKKYSTGEAKMQTVTTPSGMKTKQLIPVSRAEELSKWLGVPMSTRTQYEPEDETSAQIKQLKNKLAQLQAVNYGQSAPY